MNTLCARVDEFSWCLYSCVVCSVWTTSQEQTALDFPFGKNYNVDACSHLFYFSYFLQRKKVSLILLFFDVFMTNYLNEFEC